MKEQDIIRNLGKTKIQNQKNESLNESTSTRRKNSQMLNEYMDDDTELELEEFYQEDFMSTMDRYGFQITDTDFGYDRATIWSNGDSTVIETNTESSRGGVTLSLELNSGDDFVLVKNDQINRRELNRLQRELRKLR